MTDEDVRDFIRDPERDEGDLITDFVIVSGFIRPDGTDGIIITTSQSAPSYTVRGLLASAIDSIAARG
ncbi:hypothetical protein nbrc107696_06460 [Gordonia spumicola]|uniref:Uncharacterized protein n=1 Tax=Gordonia spumicola TaxID=589161 RepID=A0A7I9V585_9ACTN|nr:hypothetical protein [Gordonia spumicola]GEE00200.1 hypothetical protein nbrc107696_06460 [Gordonia spumicola]